MKRCLLYACISLFATAGWAQKDGPLSGYDKEHGTIIRETTMYVLPGPNSAQLTKISRGRDLAVFEKTMIDNQPWVKIFATVEVRGEEPRDVTGWVDARYVVTNSTQNGDQVIFGEAADSESQAEVRGGRKNAAQDAMRLYYRLYEYFPASPLAGEALWRAADIRWQLEKSGLLSLPSSREKDPDLRQAMDEETMKEVIKKFPNTKWADQAAYEMLDNKFCGEWKGDPSCPEKESDLYEKYVKDHPQSPKAAEALYNAAWRQGCLVDMYKSNNDRKKSDKAHDKAVALAQQVIGLQNAQGDWKPRAAVLLYALQHNIPVYGNGNDSSSGGPGPN